MFKIRWFNVIPNSPIEESIDWVVNVI